MERVRDREEEERGKKEGETGRGSIGGIENKMAERTGKKQGGRSGGGMQGGGRSAATFLLKAIICIVKALPLHPSAEGGISPACMCQVLT